MATGILDPAECDRFRILLRLLQAALQDVAQIATRAFALVVTPGKAVGSVAIAEKQQLVLRVNQFYRCCGV